MSTLAAALAGVRARPATLALAALTVGLAAGPRAPALLAPAALAVPVLTAGPLGCAGALAALGGGALLADARDDALDGPSPVTSAAAGGVTVRTRVIALEAPRRGRFGWSVFAALAGDRVLVRAGGVPPRLVTGAELVVDGRLAPPGPREGWLRARHVHATLDARAVRPSGRVRGGLAGAIDGVRMRAQRALARGLPPPEAALLRGMVLGDDSALPTAVRDELRAAGLGHLVAASGANITLLALLGLAAGAVLGLGRRARLVVVLALIAGYVPLAGGGPSIQRAGVMGAAGIAALLASRPQQRWHALLLAAAVTLALDPRALEAPGWQLSFAAVAAIGLLGGPLRVRLERRGVPGPLAEAAALTLAATLGTAPVAAATFGRVSLAALPANLLVAPIVGPVTWFGMLAAAAGQVAPGLALPLNWAAAAPLAWITFTGHVAAAMPGAQLATGAVPVLAALAVLVLVVLVPRARRPALVVLGPLLVAAVLIVRHARPAPPGPPGPGILRITALDVGQGDATLLQAGGRTVLVDSGPPDAPLPRRLHDAGVARLDVLVGTHAQADHIGGAGAVLRALPVGLVLDGRDGVRERHGTEMARAAAAGNVRLAAPQAGDALRLGGLELRVLWPPPRPAGAAAGADPNDRAIVILARLGATRVLLTADAESNVLGRLALGPVDVLKVSHHGSADPGLPALLARLRPRVALIEVGRGNDYGHPTAQALGALQAAGVRVLRTDRDGTVRVEGAGARLHVQAHA